MDKAYLAARARLVDAHSALANVKPGRRPQTLWQSAATLTAKSLFGTVLNSQLTDFTFDPVENGRPAGD